jgi:hypothetical protein
MDEESTSFMGWSIKTNIKFIGSDALAAPFWLRLKLQFL